MELLSVKWNSSGFSYLLI